ncbi:MAG: hypothetical protein R3A52_07100 [Polyangiales bacterium]
MKRLDELVRSERHFTSGLLLHLLLHADLRGVDAFVDLLVARGVLAARPVAVAATDPRTQVIAEFATRRDLLAVGGAVDETVPRDVIDVVVVVGDVLIAVEAKFFTRPTPREVRDQLLTQRNALGAIVGDPSFGVSHIVQVFLEHGRQLAAKDLGCEGVLTWDDVHGLAIDLLGENSYVARQFANARTRCDAELRTSTPGEILWAGETDFGGVVAMCRRDGDAVWVGFSGGERKLRQDSAPRLRARPWKWDRADSPLNARKDRSNWIPGRRFLSILGELGAFDAGTT